MSRTIVFLVLTGMVLVGCTRVVSGDSGVVSTSIETSSAASTDPPASTTLEVATTTTTTSIVTTTSTPDSEELGIIAYNRNGELWLMYGDGTGARSLVTDVVVDGVPAWNPDGTRIAFSGFEPGPQVVIPDIWIVDADGTGLVNLTQSPGPSMLWPSWSPDGSRIVFSDTSTRDLWTINVDNGDLVRITSDSAHQSSPAWAPDGSLIAYCVLPLDGNLLGSNDIWVANPDGSDPRRLTEMGDACSPTWSPDSQQLAFTVFEFSQEPGGDQADVWTMSRDGLGQRNLTNNPARFDRRPSWSPDGTRIVYDSAGPIVGRDDPELGLVFEHDPPSDIYSIDLDGGKRTQLTTEEHSESAPAWRPN